MCVWGVSGTPLKHVNNTTLRVSGCKKYGGDSVFIPQQYSLCTYMSPIFIFLQNFVYAARALACVYQPVPAVILFGNGGRTAPLSTKRSTFICHNIHTHHCVTLSWLLHAIGSLMVSLVATVARRRPGGRFYINKFFFSILQSTISR